MTDPLGRDTSYGYNPVGTVAFKQDDGGSCTGTISACTTYTYDAANRLQAINYSEAGTPDVTGIAYDDNGNRTEMVDTTGKSCYAYDSLNRLRSYTNGGGSGSTCNGVTVASAYDLNNNVTTLVYPGSLTVTRGFDDANRLVSVQDFQASLNTISFGYDPNSNLITETRPNGTDSVYTYSASNELNNVLHQTTSGSVRIAEYAYTRDRNSQLVKTVTNPGGGSTTDTYGYNALNKITATNAATYTYDTADNAKGFISGAVMTYDDANQPVRTNNGSPTGTLNRCYSYDGRGNRTHMILKGSATSPPCNGTDTIYNYDQANRFLGINGVASYTYNGDGLRMQKSVLTLNNYFAYDMVTGLAKPVRVGAQSGTACTAASNYDYYIYGPGGIPIKKINRTITAGGPTGGCSGTDTTTATWAAHDQQGSTRLLFDSSGTTVGTYDYDPYGQVTAHTGNNITLGYTGQWTDGNGEGGFQYLRARHYDPITAQFLTRDPANARTRSAYAYVQGSPLNYSDPSGLCVGPDAVCEAVNTMLPIVVPLAAATNADCLMLATCDDGSKSVADVDPVGGAIRDAAMIALALSLIVLCGAVAIACAKGLIYVSGAAPPVVMAWGLIRLAISRGCDPKAIEMIEAGLVGQGISSDRASVDPQTPDAMDPKSQNKRFPQPPVMGPPLPQPRNPGKGPGR